MRVGLVAPPWLPVPPPTYGGTEAVADDLARSLDELGHDVRLFTVGESACPVETRALYATPPVPMNAAGPEAAHVLAAYEALADVDVIHDHTLLGPLLGALSRPHRPPVVVTHHGVFDDTARRIFTETARHAAVVAISRSQARQAGPVPIAAVVPHGVDLSRFRPGPGDGGYLLFVGRMSPQKGADRAIRVARRCHRPLVVIAKMREEGERAYFAERVEPLLDDDVTVLFEPDADTRLDLQRGAFALLDPISWPEPFGLVMAEALATATPVVAFAAGAAPEIVDHGRTGFLCTDEDSMVEAVGRVGTIDRAACRQAAVERFSRRRMARDYLAVYAAARRGAELPRPPALVPVRGD